MAHPKQDPVPALLRSRRAGLVLLATGALALLLARAAFSFPWPPRPWSEAAAAGARSGSGAASELARTRREQALIRAEETIELLRVLDGAPTLGGGS